MSWSFYKVIMEEMYTDEPDLSHRDQLGYHHHIYQQPHYHRHQQQASY